MHCNWQMLSHYIFFPFVLWLEARFSFVLWLYFLHIIDLRQTAFRQESAFLGFCPSHTIQFSSVQSFNHVRLFATPWITAHQASLSITSSRSSLKCMSIKSVMPSSHLILCHSLLLLSPIPPSIRVFSNESTLRMRWPEYWSFSFSIIPSKEHPGLISFRMDWLNLLAVQGILESSPTTQFKSINSSVLRFPHSPTLTSTHDHRKNP